MLKEFGNMCQLKCHAFGQVGGQLPRQAAARLYLQNMGVADDWRAAMLSFIGNAFVLEELATAALARTQCGCLGHNCAGIDDTYASACARTH